MKPQFRREQPLGRFAPRREFQGGDFL